MGRKTERSLFRTRMADVKVGLQGSRRHSDVSHVAHVGAAASAEDANMRELPPNVGKLLRQLVRITVIQFFRFIQLGMTATRCVRDEPLDP